MVEIVPTEDDFDGFDDLEDSFNLEALLSLQQVNALSKGHFVYASGRHGNRYINKDALYAHPQETARVANQLTAHFAFTNLDLRLKIDVDVVVGAPIGGVILAHYAANALQRHFKNIDLIDYEKEVQVAYPEKQTSEYEFKRGYDQRITGKKVLVVEDIVTTGATLELVLQAVQNSGGEVLGCACIVNRTGKTDALVRQQLRTLNFCSLIQIQTPTYSPDQCPLCQQGIPINTTLGYGAKT